MLESRWPLSSYSLGRLACFAAGGPDLPVHDFMTVSTRWRVSACRRPRFWCRITSSTTMSDWRWWILVHHCFLFLLFYFWHWIDDVYQIANGRPVDNFVCKNKKVKSAFFTSPVVVVVLELLKIQNDERRHAKDKTRLTCRRWLLVKSIVLIGSWVRMWGNRGAVCFVFSTCFYTLVAFSSRIESIIVSVCLPVKYGRTKELFRGWLILFSLFAIVLQVPAGKCGRTTRCVVLALETLRLLVHHSFACLLACLLS